MQLKIYAALRDGISCLLQYLLMPFFGWWLAERALASPTAGNFFASFISEPPRAAYLVVVAAQITVTGVMAARLPLTTKRFSLRPTLLHWRMIALEAILVVGPYCDHRGVLVFGETTWLRWLGIMLFSAGTALALWSAYVRSWTVARLGLTLNDPVLVVDGPYRRLRYPVYLGLLLLSLGGALIFRSWFGLGAFCLIFNFIVMRISDEDHTAKIKFGIRWTAYSRHSWRLVPFIY